MNDVSGQVLWKEKKRVSFMSDDINKSNPDAPDVSGSVELSESVAEVALVAGQEDAGLDKKKKKKKKTDKNGKKK